MAFVVILGAVLVVLIIIFMVTGSTPTTSTGDYRPPAPLSLGDRQRLEELLRQGKKIEAIKSYKALMGCGLREAKDAIEALQGELNL